MLNWFTKKTDLLPLQIFLLLLLAFSLPLSFEVELSAEHKMFVPTEPLLILFVIVVVLDIILKRARLRDLINKTTLIVTPFIFALIFSTLFSTMLVVSLKFSAVNLLYIFSFYISLQFILKKAPWLFSKLLALYTASFLLICCIAVYRYALYDWNPVTVKGIFLPFYKDHTIFGASAALLAGYWLFSPVAQASFLRILFRRFIGLLMVAAVFLSFSRAAIISLAVIGIVYPIFYFRTRLWHFMTLLGLVMILVLLNGQFLISLINQNSFDSGNKQSDIVEHTLSSGNVNTDVSNLERLNRWDAGLRMFSNKPVTGYGPGTYQFAYIPFQRPEKMTRLSVKNPDHIPENSGGTAHSEYILSAGEMGIPGLLAWLALLLGPTLILFRTPLNQTGRMAAIAAFAALSSYYFHAIFNNFLNTDKFAFLFWGLIAWFFVNAINEKTA